MSDNLPEPQQTTTGTHIIFYPCETAPYRKTAIWQVRTKDHGDHLGEIRWFGRWRKYCFFPANDCVFEEVCMREISQFIVGRTVLHRTGMAIDSRRPDSGWRERMENHNAGGATD